MFGSYEGLKKSPLTGRVPIRGLITASTARSILAAVSSPFSSGSFPVRGTYEPPVVFRGFVNCSRMLHKNIFHVVAVTVSPATDRVPVNLHKDALFAGEYLLFADATLESGCGCSGSELFHWVPMRGCV